MFSNLTSYIFGSKSEAEEAVDAAVAAPEEATASNNPRSSNGTAIGTVCAAGALAAKAQKSARAAFLKRSAKGHNAKKSEKQNKVSKSGNACGKRAAVKHNLPIKSAGCNKQLKQC